MPDDPDTPSPSPIPGPTPTGYQRTQGGDFKWQPPSAGHLSKLLPQYEIECILGCGGMGAVYKGKQKSLDRTVAIKILPPGLEDEDFSCVERFKNEAKVMAKFMHPAIVGVFDFGETSEGQLYIVMEFVDGTDVQKMLQAQGRLPPEHALAITAHVCDALKYAHEHGVIHRDIKPANVLLNMEGAVKVADFGLAKAEEPGVSGITKTGAAVGTPDFVAPEVLMLGVDVDARADLYAVGAMLYQMLTGRAPRGSLEAPSRLVGTDPRFDPIVFRAMKYDREERYQTAIDIRKDLDVILTTPIVKEGGPSSAAVPKQSLPARNALHGDAGGPQKPVAKGPQAPDGRRVRQNAVPEATPDRTLVSAPTARSKAPLLIGIGIAAAVAIGAFFFSSGSRQTSDERPPASASARPTDQTLASSAASSAPIKVRENPKTAAEPVSNPKSTTSNPSVSATSLSSAPAPAKSPVTPPASITPAPDPKAVSPMLGAPGISATAVQNAAAPSPSPLISSSPSPPPLPPELAALDAQFIKLQGDTITGPFEADLAKLNTGYLGGIARKIAEEKAAGHLDGILALEAEQKLIADKQPVPDKDDEKTPASLKALRAIYRTAYEKLAATRAVNLKALTDPLDARLVAMETSFTKADRLADAKVVRGYREALAEGKGDIPVAQTAASGSAAARMGDKDAAPPLNPAAMLAMKDGITNSLGMKFLPVKGTEVLFCIHETRRLDYAAYANEVPSVDGAWKNQQRNGIPCGDKDDHPVVGVSWEDAQKFCEWLSKKEGRTYRLPTDEEWSIAVGLGRKEKHGKGITPEMLNGKETTEFPWGGDYPPKTKDQAGNYGDTAWTEKFPTEPGMKDYTDGFPTTAPVMSFKPNKLGLYDMGGNVWEWVEDWWNAEKTDRVLRGGSFSPYDRGYLLSSYRHLPTRPAVAAPTSASGV